MEKMAKLLLVLTVDDRDSVAYAEADFEESKLKLPFEQFAKLYLEPALAVVKIETGTA